MIVEEKLHILNKQGQVMDIALTDSKSEALGTDEGDGSCFSEFINGRILYAATNDKVEAPDLARFMFKDSQGQLRYVHGIPGKKTLVLDAVYTGDFDINLNCPYGGRIIVRSSNGSQGYNGKSAGWSDSHRYGGNSGYGWKLNLGNLSDYVEFTAPSGGGGGARGQKSGYPAGNGGVGSQLIIEFGKLILPLSARTGLNGGGEGTYHKRPLNDDGGPGGASWPYSDSSAATHRGQTSPNQPRETYTTSDYGGYNTTTHISNYGSKGGAGGAGYKNQAVKRLYANGTDRTYQVDNYPNVEVNVGGFDIYASLSDLSTATHSVEIYKYKYI